MLRRFIVGVRVYSGLRLEVYDLQKSSKRSMKPWWSLLLLPIFLDLGETLNRAHLLRSWGRGIVSRSCLASTVGSFVAGHSGRGGSYCNWRL